MTKLSVGGRERDIAEPVFKQLRRIIAAYNQLASDCPDAVKIAAIEILLACLLDGKVKLKHLSNDELAALLQAIPAVCHLETKAGTANAAQPIEWGNVYAHLSATFGWDYDYIDNHMTLSRLNEYRQYMTHHPPTHQLVAAYLGYEYQDKQAGNGFLKAIAAQAKQAKHNKASS